MKFNLTNITISVGGSPDVGRFHMMEILEEFLLRNRYRVTRQGDKLVLPTQTVVLEDKRVG